MLTKLLKYDFKSILKLFVPIWVALVALSLSGRLLISLRIDSEILSVEFLSTITFLIFYLLLCAMYVVSAVLIVQRFYRGLLRDEGYLMFTLPVKPWQLIASKAITAMAIVLVSSFIALVSFLILGLLDLFFDLSWTELYRDLFQSFTAKHGLILGLGLLASITGILKLVTQVYASLSFGHLFNKHRIALSVAGFIGINIILSTVTSSLIQVDIFTTGIMEQWGQLFTVAPEDAILLALGAALVVDILQTALFFFGTEWMLRKHLNLE